MSDAWQDEISRTMMATAAAQFAVLEANVALPGRRFGSPGYGDRVAVVDAAALALGRGRWLFNRATGECADYDARTSSVDDLVAARAHLGDAVRLADASREPDAETLAEARAARERLTRDGTEILFDGDVPVVPSIAPIVVLRGSSYAMGAQYVQQCVEIFGAFVFEHAGRRALGEREREVLRNYESQMREHTPELLEMCTGMADGALQLGVDLSYEHALAIWTDVLPPSTEPVPFGVLDAEGGATFDGYLARAMSAGGAEVGTCSGAAAWGRATRDGRACFASSTDHECTFQVTIAAFPDDGHAFVYTPFSVNASIPGMGRFGLSGHPGFNAAGVTYVHHGGYESCAEPQEHWGYGVPRGATTMHVLRYADSAREAQRMELAFPVGDAGRILQSAGGFYVDDDYGYVLEDRTPGRPIVRERTPDPDGERHELLYATNNLLSPDSGEGFCPPPGGYEYEVDAGWYTLAPQGIDQVSPGVFTRQACTAWSVDRNRYLYRRLTEQAGDITTESLLELFEVAPRFEIDHWDRDGMRMPHGTLVEGSVGGRQNAFVAFGSASSGRYSGAIGMIAPRSATENGPAPGFTFFDETGAWWDIHLGDSPGSLARDARATAERDVAAAREGLDGSGAGAGADVGALRGLLAQAELELASGDRHQQDPDADVAGQARACRAFTRAQVRARQVLDALAL